MFWWDPHKRIFVGAAKRSHNNKRAQAYAWSRDMIHWSVTRDWIHVADKGDRPQDEAEAAYCFPYGSQWIGFGEMRRIRKSDGGVVDRGATINWELLTSHDGKRWSRPMRELFFADSTEKTWRHQVFKIFANPPIERDGRLLIYYGGKTGTVPIDKGNKPFQALCLATLRKDGFVSLTAGNQVGELVTKPFVASNESLLFNVDVSARGEARVEVLDVNMRAIPGFELSRSIPLRGRSTEQSVGWNDGTKWSQLSGRTVRLRVRLRSADFYSLWTATDS